MMSIIKSVKSFLAECPQLAGKSINENYLGGNIPEFSIENIAAEPIVKRYSDGGVLKQFCFALSMRAAYDDDASENMKTAEFLERFERWIEKKNRENELPNLSCLHLQAERVEVTKSGCLYDTAVASANFRIELRLLYKQH